MFDKHRCEVLIVGAGPVGLFAALTLTVRGIKVQIVDRQRRTNLHSYALALHSRSLQLLDDLGLAPDLIANGYQVQRAGFYEGDIHHGTLNFTKLESPYPVLLVIAQSELEHALEKKLESHGVKVRWNHELLALSAEGTAAKALVGKMDDVPQGYPSLEMHRMVTSEHTISSDFVIGADGYHSSVREFAGLEIETFADPQSFSVYEFSTPVNLDHEVRIVLSDQGTNVLWPLPNGRCRWSFQIPSPRDHDGTAERLRQLLDQRASWFYPLPDSLEWSSSTSFTSRLVKRFGRDDVWLAGDAAHLTGPVGVQSMNAGLREGYELAWRMFEILRNNASRNILQVYNSDRSKEWRRLLGKDGQIEPLPEASEWIRLHKNRILPCVPASGSHLDALLLQIGLETV